MRQQFAKTVYDTLSSDSSAAILIGDISHYLLRETEEDFPNRFYNMGICEQSMVGMAAGLSIGGIRPIVHTITPFCVERAFEQIKIDVSYQNLPVSIVTVGASFDYASLGCTHHCYEDIALMRTLPNVQVFVPGSSKEFDNLFKESWKQKTPNYFKLTTKEHSLGDVSGGIGGLVHIKKSNSHRTVIVCGHLVDDVLESGIDCNVLYTASMTGLSKDSLETLSKNVGRETHLYVVEENSVVGGLGDAILESISCNNFHMPARFKRLGIPVKWLTNYGKASEHREALGLTPKGIREAIDV